MDANIDVRTLIIDGKLDLTDRKLTLSEFEELVKSPAMGEVRELDLRYNFFGHKGAQALADSKTLCNLTSLDLLAAS